MWPQDGPGASPTWAPGWYADPYNPAFLRWFDGQQWTQASKRARRRPAIIGPLVISAAIIAAVIFALQQPSVSVPLAGSQDCGASSFSLTTGLASYVTPTNDTFGIGQALQDECKAKAQHNIEIAAVIFVVGLIGGGVIAARERSL